MKKILLLCAMCAFTLSSLAQYDFSLKTAEGATLYYKITKDPYEQYDKTGVILGEVTVVPEIQDQYNGMYYNRPYNTFGYHLVIPDTISYAGTKYIVTAIGDHAFQANDGYYAHSVIIPRTVKTIGEWAFYEALPNKTGVTAAITIPENVTSIGRYAFYSCDKLDVTWLAKKCEVAPTSFTGALNTILFGTNVEEVPANLCYENRNLNAVTLPYAIKKVGDYAFYNCNGVTNIDIVDGVKSIGNCALYGCSNLETLYISNTIESIDDNAFAECNNLLEIKIGSKKAITASENVFSSDAYNNACLYVPTGRKFAYEKTAPWSNFYIVEMDFTGIEELKSENGKVKTIYDINGRAVENPAKGIYIINGKKVIIK